MMFRSLDRAAARAAATAPDAGWLEWFWSLLPDKCEMRDCERHGVRGNENIVHVNGMATTVCDYCHAKMMRPEP